LSESPTGVGDVGQLKNDEPLGEILPGNEAESSNNLNSNRIQNIAEANREPKHFDEIPRSSSVSEPIDDPWFEAAIDGESDRKPSINKNQYARRPRITMLFVTLLFVLVGIVGFLLIDDIFNKQQSSNELSAKTGNRVLPEDQESTAQETATVETATAETATAETAAAETATAETATAETTTAETATAETVVQLLPINDSWYINIGASGPSDYLDLASIKLSTENLPSEQDCQDFVEPFNRDADMMNKVSVHGFPVPVFWIKRKNGALAICKINESAANIYRANIPRNAPTRADKAIVPKLR